MGGYTFPLKDSSNYKNLIVGPIGIDEVVCGKEVYVSQPLWEKQMPLIQKEILRWKKNIHKISAVHVTTKSEKTEMNEFLGVPPEKMTIFPLGVEHDLFTHPDDKNKIRKKILSKFGMPDQNYFIHISELNHARKNVLRMLDAFKEARTRGITQKLIVVGKTHTDPSNHVTCFPHANCKEIDKRFMNDSEVIPLGYVSQSDMVELIQGSDALILPSIHEGFGMPLVECMACGVPSITSDKHSPPEVVGDAGLLVDPYNVSDIANKMVEINEGNTLQILSQRALQRSKNYSWETYATKIFELYEKNAKFTGDWDFEKQYELAAYRSLLFVCVFVAGKENKMLSEYLLDLDFQKIVQWASEYGLKDPKVRDFLIPFKRFIENYSENHDYNKLSSDDFQLVVAEGLKQSNEALQAMVMGLKQSNEALQAMVMGLKQSNEALQVMVMGLEESKEKDAEMIKGLEESKEKDVDMIKGLEESVEKFKKTVDEIYNSTTWKLASKFTGGQTKRKKN
jgi:glycosyltransferase involved in cell wall biosynthesis